MDMSKMLKDLQKMQSKMLKAQNDLKTQSFDAEAGGGMVKVAINGQGVLTMINTILTCRALRHEKEIEEYLRKLDNNLREFDMFYN